MTQDTTLSAEDWQGIANSAGLGLANGYNLWAHYTDTLARLAAAEAALVHAHGSFSVTAPAATTITTPGTFYKAAGATTAGDLVGFTSTDNRLTYSGTADVCAHIVTNMSVTCANNAQLLEFAVYKNGAQLLPSLMKQRLGTGTDIQIVTIHADCDLVTGDFLEVWCTNATTSAAITLQYAYMYAMGLTNC